MTLYPSLAAAAVTALASGVMIVAGGGDGTAPVDFDRDVRPIFKAHCLECHGADDPQGGLRLDQRAAAMAGSKGGQLPIIISKHADDSILIERVSAGNAADRMPLKAPALASADVATLRRWIDEGAAWPLQPGESETFDAKRHWAYEKIKNPAPPAVRLAGWARQPWDAFILARLEKEGLAPSPDAPRGEWLRRVTLDLTGLPPTPAELQQFLDDRRADAFERAADRCLSSPRYGERMARPWLDLARYADTNGYEKDARRTIWPYRDWVIRAFNDDMPFDRFTIEQLAGDLLPNAGDAQRIATGFHRNTMVNQEGGVDPEEFRAAAVIDRVNTTAAVWLGSTLNCCQCHNHKYDPFTQREYYGLFAFLNNSADGSGDLEPTLRVESPESHARLEALTAAAAAERASLADLQKKHASDAARWAEGVRAATPPEPAWRVPAVSRAEAKSGSKISMRPDGAFLVSGDNPATDAYELALRCDGGAIEALRLEALADPSLPLGGTSRASHANFVITEIEAEVRRDGAAPEPIRFAQAAADYEQTSGDFHAALTIDGVPSSGWAVGSTDPARVAAPHRLILLPDHAVSPPAGAELRVRIRMESPYAQHNLGCGRVSLTADPAVRAIVGAPALGAWLHAGPFAAENYQTAYDRAFAPETECVSRAPFAAEYERGSIRWTEKKDWDSPAVHPLRGDNSAHYLRRMITSAVPRRVVLRVGSDDGVKIWLNGELIHDHNIGRAAEPGSDLVDALLARGENTLLMKVVNGGGPSGFAFELRRFADPFPAAELESYYFTAVDPSSRDARRHAAEADRAAAAFRESLPTTPVMMELPKPRDTRLFVRGSFLNPGDPVAPHTPAVLPPLADGAARDRLALARWLVTPDNPLTPRVEVNRLWAMLFGSGIVSTLEDFGTRSEPPSHPELLDALATQFMRDGWSIKKLLRSIVLSSAYRQSSAVSPASLERDPANRLVSRGPRFRMEAEMLRDFALSVSGLLHEQLGGPSVFPIQPDGIWNVVYNGDQWMTSPGADAHRRGIYTFLRRTSPYPTFLLFDAPSRELACARRPTSNTPLQALATLNDPAFVEAAAGLARRLLIEARGGDDARFSLAFRLCQSREPRADETAVLAALIARQRARFAADAKGAAALARGTHLPALDGVADGELAAWTVAANVVLNLDETLTRN